jgi:PhnB protein
MTSLHPWINFNGNAEEAFTFYKSLFGGEFTKIIRFKDIATAEFPVPEEEAEKLILITLPLGDHSMLMGNDVPAFMGTVNERENRSKISVRTDSKEEADKLFAGLSVGGEVEVPISDSNWGTYFGMLRDKYGIEWVIEFPATA